VVELRQAVAHRHLARRADRRQRVALEGAGVDRAVGHMCSSMSRIAAVRYSTVA
jgi:hypothetical protein